MKQVLIPASLLTELVDALADRIHTADYLKPEQYDDEEHEQTSIALHEQAVAALKEARSHLPKELTEEESLRQIQIIDLAQAQCGDAEVNDDSIISEGNDNGCYVSAWVWVDFAGTPLDKELEEEDNDFDPRAVTTGYTDCGID